MSKKNNLKKRLKKIKKHRKTKINLSKTKNNLSTLLFEMKEKKEVVEPVHDLDWAKNVLQTRDNGTSQHYKDYYEALEILYKSGQPYYFME
jgi:methylthioribose-1-phosphate isomerase